MTSFWQMSEYAFQQRDSIAGNSFISLYVQALRRRHGDRKIWRGRWWRSFLYGSKSFCNVYVKATWLIPWLERSSIKFQRKTEMHIDRNLVSKIAATDYHWVSHILSRIKRVPQVSHHEVTRGRSSGPNVLFTVHLCNFWHKAEWYRQELTDTTEEKSIERNKKGKFLKKLWCCVGGRLWKARECGYLRCVSSYLLPYNKLHSNLRILKFVFHGALFGLSSGSVWGIMRALRW